RGDGRAADPNRDAEHGVDAVRREAIADLGPARVTLEIGALHRRVAHERVDTRTGPELFLHELERASAVVGGGEVADVAVAVEPQDAGAVDVEQRACARDDAFERVHDVGTALEPVEVVELGGQELGGDATVHNCESRTPSPESGISAVSQSMP